VEASFERPERTARRASVAKKRYKMRYTTLEDRSTSCLVSTHDRISGTHRLTKASGIDKRISPHSLRHSFITAALDAGVPLRDVQEAASHSDPRTTMRYDRGRGSLDRHATYIVSTFVAGASR
jgi:site-specific recombinase XerD